MVTIGICDDEQNMRKMLRPVVERTCQLLGQDVLILEYGSGEEFLAAPPSDLPDILFLDIEMKMLSGMDTARMLRQRGGRTILIFVTAYPDFVFQGYEVHAFHYILKPYKEHKISSVLIQALEELEKNGEQYLTIEQKSGIQKLPLSRTHLFQSDKRKLLAYTETGLIDFYGKLNEIQEELPSYFIRIHNRYLVNLNFVTSVEKDTCLCAGKACPVSRAYKQELEIAFARTLLK